MVAVIHREDMDTRPRALVVDDSRIARYVLHGLLDRLGFEVDLADSAELAVRQLCKGLPDVVFMDHLLPGIDGLECVRRLRAQPRSARLPIVMYTSQDSEAFAARAKAAGADDVFFKTGETQKLSEILGRLELLPETSEAAAGPRVLTIPRDRAEEAEPPARAARENSRAEVLQALEPLVQAQHEKLRQDLLAEFVILERYEERMRNDLFGRLGQMVQASNERLDGIMRMRRSEDTRRQRENRGWRRYAIAASCLLMLTAGLVTGLTIRPGVLDADAGGERAAAAMEAQAASLAEVRQSLEELRLRVPAEEHKQAATTDAGAQPAATVLPDAATALITELQSMGILGQVRIETSAGAFCVRAAADGFMLELAGRALNDCEVLPVYTAGLQ